MTEQDRTEQNWDRTVDVVVVGSGAAGLVAALAAADGGATVEVFEKADLVGGTSAWSGGMPWMPLNAHQSETGIPDSRDEVLAYIAGLSEGREPDPALVEVFIDHAAEALAFIEKSTPLEMRTLTAYPDYYSDRPNSKLRGRSVEPVALASRDLLGDWYDRVRESPLMPRLMREEMGSDIDVDAVTTERETAGVRTLGSALVSGILRGVLDRGVEVTTGTAVTDLVVGNGAVVGVVAEHDGSTIRIGARRGVVLASGGFEWNDELVKAYLGNARIFPLTPEGNVGDGLRMGLELGARVGNMTNAVTRPIAWDGSSIYMSTPRQDPGCIIVGRNGRRFVNEGISYMDMGKAFRAYDPRTQSYPDAGPVWMIFDQSVRERTRVGAFVPDSPTPDWVEEGATIAELARAIDIDPHALAGEIDRFNGFVATGIDLDFGRGTIWFEGLSIGGPSAEKNLAKIEHGPFYAMRLYNGVFGTIGGLRVNEHARVLAESGGTIEGLWAVGNVAAGVLGQSYPGGGSSLGPNLTFGYLAGRDLAQHPARG
jgi:3-oxosteroid 1-dehydrogenase